MKKYILFIALITMSTAIFSQRMMDKQTRKEMKEKFKSERIGFITSELNLSPEEAKKFWPIFDEYDEKREDIKDQIYSKMEAADMQVDNPDAFLNDLIKLREQELNLDKSYILQLKTAISTSKIVKLMTLERKFKEELFKRVRKKMWNRGRE